MALPSWAQNSWSRSPGGSWPGGVAGQCGCNPPACGPRLPATPWPCSALSPCRVPGRPRRGRAGLVTRRLSVFREQGGLDCRPTALRTTARPRVTPDLGDARCLLLSVQFFNVFSSPCQRRQDARLPWRRLVEIPRSVLIIAVPPAVSHEGRGAEAERGASAHSCPEPAPRRLRLPTAAPEPRGPAPRPCTGSGRAASRAPERPSGCPVPGGHSLHPVSAARFPRRLLLGEESSETVDVAGHTAHGPVPGRPPRQRPHAFLLPDAVLPSFLTWRSLPRSRAVTLSFCSFG